MWTNPRISPAQAAVQRASRPAAGSPYPSYPPSEESVQPSGAPILVIVDSSVAAASVLAAGAVDEAIVTTIDAQQDGIEQIRALCQRHRTCGIFPFAEVHLVTRGRAEGLGLGHRLLDLAGLEEQAAAIADWFPAPQPPISEAPTLVLYGYGAMEAGEEFLQRFHQLTGAAIVASQQPMGRTEQGTSWQFDVQVGAGEEVLRSLRPAFTAATCRDYAHSLSGLAESPLSEACAAERASSD